MKVHTIKAGEPDYGSLVAGKKTSLILPAGTEYQPGDLLMICQFINNNFTGLDIGKKVASVAQSGEGVPPGCIRLELEQCENTVDSSAVPMNVQREGFDFLSRSKFGDCPHCGKPITSDTSPERCGECGSPVIWSESKFGGL